MFLRGEKFHLTAGGRTLQRVRDSTPAKSSLPRVHIGGLTYSRTRTGLYELTKTHQARAVLRYIHTYLAVSLSLLEFLTKRAIIRVGSFWMIGSMFTWVNLYHVIITDQAAQLCLYYYHHAFVELYSHHWCWFPLVFIEVAERFITQDHCSTELCTPGSPQAYTSSPISLFIVMHMLAVYFKINWVSVIRKTCIYYDAPCRWRF